jgi:2-keto-4-pentenoate hydratase/2-oxohepta-3-ene-1,7-dioic acid hydratase in catechol pathway
MRLVTFRYEGVDFVGALRGDQVIPLTRAYAGHLHSLGITAPYILAEAQLPNGMLELLRVWERGQVAVQRAVEYVEGRVSEEGGPRGPMGERLMLPLSEVKLLAPVPRPGKLMCIGLNYSDHAAEIEMKKPERPILFAKFATCVVGPGEPVVLPSISNEVDWEAELGVVIGKTAKGVSEEDALEYVAGYTVFNDVSARDVQLGDGQWVRGKSFDTFGPMGPALVTPDEVPDPHSLRISLRLNGAVMQDSTTGNLIFNVPELISFLSQVITLEPGDLIATGTPSGVGLGRKPPVYLKAGDHMVIEVEKVGVLETPVVAE